MFTDREEYMLLKCAHKRCGHEYAMHRAGNDLCPASYKSGAVKEMEWRVEEGAPGTTFKIRKEDLL